MSYSLHSEMSGLSFAARAVLATATALTYEFQEDDIAARSIRSCLGLSHEAWIAAYDELYEAGHLYRVRDLYGDLEIVCLNSSGDILRTSMGPGGRAVGREWKELRDLTFAAHPHFCIYCQAADEPLVVDHVVPVSRGGSNHLRNLVLACQDCNGAKGNKPWDEWYPLIDGRRAARARSKGS